MFCVGQKVVCINTAPGKHGLSPTWPETKFPVGTASTRSDPCSTRASSAMTMLPSCEEVRNRPRAYTSARGRKVRCEQFWLGFRSRPLHRTNIDVFKAIFWSRRQSPEFHFVPRAEQTETEPNRRATACDPQERDPERSKARHVCGRSAPYKITSRVDLRKERLPAMKVPITPSAIAVVLATSLLTASLAQTQPPPERQRPSPEARARLLDGRMAMVKETLKLSDAQLKLWAPVEQQIRANAAEREKRREERLKRRQEAQTRGAP